METVLAILQQVQDERKGGQPVQDERMGRRPVQDERMGRRPVQDERKGGGGRFRMSGWGRRPLPSFPRKRESRRY